VRGTGGEGGGEGGSVVQRMDEWKRGRGKYVPLEAREKDIDYQRQRVKIFRGLLQKLHQAQDKGTASLTVRPAPLHFASICPLCPGRDIVVREIVRTAAVDIPQVLRADVWAVLLGLHNKTEEEVHTPTHHTSSLSCKIRKQSLTLSSHSDAASLRRSGQGERGPGRQADRA